MNEVEANKHANELLRHVVESLGEILPSGTAIFTGLDSFIVHFPVYDNIGAQLGQAVNESIEKEVSELEQVLEAQGERRRETGELTFAGNKPYAYHGKEASFLWIPEEDE